MPTTPLRRPADVISRIQANSGRRRRSMSVGDAEWNTMISQSSPSKAAKTPQNRAESPSMTLSSPAKPSDKQRPVSASTSSSGYATARSDTTPIATPAQETPPTITTTEESVSRSVHTIRPSRDWKNALEGWDHQVASLEITDPTLSSSTSSNTLGSPTSPTKVRPRSRTQDPMPIPPRLSLGKAGNPGTPTRAGSVGSPPAGFSLPPDSASSSTSSMATSNSGTARSPSFSLYSTPPSGPPSASPSTFAVQQATPTRRGSAAAALPFTGPVIIGSTPASIGHTTTKVTIQRDKEEQSTTPMNSPKPSTSPSGSSSPHSSPMSPHSNQRRSSSSQRPSSPQLQLPSGISPTSIGIGRAGPGSSLRVSSLRNTARPTLNTFGTPSTSPSTNAGTLRAAGSPARNETYAGHGSPKISLSLTSPSQENLRYGATSAGPHGARANELRAIYGLKNAASASEPTLLPPGGSGATGIDDSIKTIRLITSGSRLGSVNGRGGEFGENGELGGTRLSSPTSSVKHTFSNTSAGTSVGRSSRDGSSGTMNGSGSVLVAEDVESQAEIIARRIWEDDESFRSREKFAEWLGRP